MDKLEAIKKFGKNDGFDDDRWASAIQMAGEIDKSPSLCFERLIKLEDSGHIELTKGPASSHPLAESGAIFLDVQENCLKILVDGEMLKYPTVEQYTKMMKAIEVVAETSFVQSLAQTAFRDFTTAWTRGDYKDKAITMESVFMMGYHLGWFKKEDNIHSELLDAKNNDTNDIK